MKLNVPLFKQKSSLSCGLACLSMVFNYYGKQIYEDEILKNVRIIKNKRSKKAGTFAVDLAKYAKSNGLKVVCYSYNLEVFQPSYEKLPKNKLKKKLSLLFLKENNKFRKKIIRKYIQLLESGIELKIFQPQIKTIEKYLKKNIPVILAVNSKILFGKDSLENWFGHYIVVTGFSKNNFYYNDPALGEEMKINKEKLFFALCVNSVNSSGYMIVVY